jgi:hypothetical protein
MNAPYPYTPPPSPIPTRNTPWYKRLWVVGVIAALVGIGIGAASASGSSKKAAAKPGPTVTATVVSTAPAPPAATKTLRPTIIKTIATRTRVRTETFTPPPKPAFSDGTYKVGRDINAGEYRSAGGADCYYQRMNDLSGSLDSIIVNDNFSGSSLVHVNNGEYFEVAGGCDWRRT